MPNDYIDAPSLFYTALSVLFIIGGTVIGILAVGEGLIRADGSIVMGILFIFMGFSFGIGFLVTLKNVKEDRNRNRGRSNV